MVWHLRMMMVSLWSSMNEWTEEQEQNFFLGV